ncbi:Uncharacterized protein PBTT_10170 [Plasmodiophora brassicae]|uniref:Uncharacterized protein n=1 Tax=Plasmodiophora brassicae TaxID=37360 RepID=A0A0G4INW7_PLABS|nr:hypothetical protein PBRA_005469 [Plasmodiophora brassicae]
MASVRVIVAFLASSLVALGHAVHSDDNPHNCLKSRLTVDLAPMLLSNLDNSDVWNVTQLSSNLTMSAYARDVLGIRRQWEMLFKPEASQESLLSFFESSQGLDQLRNYVPEEWARGNLHRRVPLRPQILLLDILFDFDHDGSPGHFEMILKTLAVDWRLADGYALGVAVRHTSEEYDDVQHRKRALNAVQFLLERRVTFLNDDGCDGYAASASERIAASREFPVLYDERDEITSVLLKLLPERDRNLVRMALSGLASCDIENQIEGPDQTVNLDLLRVLVAHGMDINEPYPEDDDTPRPDSALLEAAVFDGDYRAANLLITLGAGLIFDNPSSTPGQNPCGIDEVCTFAEHIMTFDPYYGDMEVPYIILAGQFEPWRQRLGLAGVNKPVLLETCLKALRRRFGVEFDEHDFKRRILVYAMSDLIEPEFSFEQLLGIFDDDTVILSGAGVSALTTFDDCDVDDPVSVLDRLARHATDAQVQAALRHVTTDGHSIFHKKCMTGDIVRWILRRSSSRDWVWDALQLRSTRSGPDSGASCMELWMRGSRDSPNVIIPILRELTSAADGTMSAYQIAMLACGGSRRGEATFLSWLRRTRQRQRVVGGE